MKFFVCSSHTAKITLEEENRAGTEHLLRSTFLAKTVLPYASRRYGFRSVGEIPYKKNSK